MPSTRDIRRRIKSIKNTAQITKAMQLVAAAKMKKAQDQATNGRPYAELLNKVLVSLKDAAEEGSHPFLAEGKGSKTLVLVITSDKGLCGALNTNLLKKLISTKIEGEVDYLTIGRKGAQGLARLRKNLIADFTIKDPAKFSEIRTVGHFIQDKFLTGEYKTVHVAFNNFINTVTIVPTVEQLLPVDRVTSGRQAPLRWKRIPKPRRMPRLRQSPDYAFEPDAATVFEAILPQYVNNTIYQMLLEARASEHSSRMVAMKNATDNAKQMLKDLSLEYNKLRQAAITNELLEITTAKMALQ